MSFGWSVADCFAALNLLIEVFSSLKDSGGSRSEYQELVRELSGLKIALQHIENLVTRDNTLSPRLVELKSIALACRVPLEEFISKVKNYEKSLGSETPKRRKIVKDTTRKILWLGMKADIHKLQHYLNTHIGTINVLLAEFQLEYLNLASEQASSNKQEMQSHLRTIQDAIEATRTTALLEKQVIESHIKTIRDEIKAAASKITDATAVVECSIAAVQYNTSLLQRILGVLQRDSTLLPTPLVNILSNVRTTTAQIYTIVLEIRSSLTGPDPRFSWFQVPVKVEDALGRIFPVPSEYSFSELECIIRMKFANSPGYDEVMAGNYELSNRKNSKHVLSDDGSVSLLPGMSIVMAIIVDQVPLIHSICPMPKCGSIDTAVAEGGGRKCLTCDVWFDGTNKKRKNEDEREVDSDEHILNRQLYNRHSTIRPRGHITQYEVFRNVRCGQLRKLARAAPPGCCHSCNSRESPEWRRGPDGARTLCNPCGLHYAKLTRKMGNKKRMGASLLLGREV
jgi:hypothetical protein